jgi:putative DNA primase/helicase
MNTIVAEPETESQQDSASVKEIKTPHRANQKRHAEFDAQTPKGGGGLPEIKITSGGLTEMTDRAESIMISSKAGIYQRSGKLVRIITEATKPRPKRKKSPDENEIKRAEDALVIAEVDYIYLTEILGKIARWIRFDERTQQYKQKDCPEKVSRTLLARRIWDLPVLTGIIQAPTLRPDGSILENPGYDEETGLYFEPGQTVFLSIPEHPSREDAKTALDLILEVICEFPFEGSESRSVAVSAIITALIRKSIRTAPLHGFTAPKMSSGKSLLADVVGLIATGKVNCAIPHAENESEEKKRLLAVLSEGDPVLCFDNIERPFGSPAMCSILSQTEYKDRILGSTRNLGVSTSATFLATGNNLTFVGDISTRVVLCRLDPRCERPEERNFEKDLYKYIPKVRGKLVIAALTILRAYHVAGRPKQEILPFGRFEEWSDLVRSALVWLDEEDPCKSRKEVENTDPVRASLGSLLSAWYEAFGDMSRKIRDVIKAVEDEKLVSLREALIELAPDKNGINSRSLGKKFASFKGRIENGYRLDSCGQYQGVDTWRVTKT